MFIFKGN